AAGPRAEAMIDRLDDRGDLRALLANTIGGVHLLAGDVDAARGRFASAIALAADDPRVDPIDHARGYLQNAALVADDPGEREALFVQASERLAEKLGPTHPATLRLQQSWADLTVDAAAARE